MRVYYKGQAVPMADVTWDTLCSPSTYTAWDQDPDADFPDAVKRARAQAPLVIARALRAPRRLIERLQQRLVGYGGLLCR